MYYHITSISRTQKLRLREVNNLPKVIQLNAWIEAVLERNVWL